MANSVVKGGLSHGKRPPFALQKAAFGIERNAYGNAYSVVLAGRICLASVTKGVAFAYGFSQLKGERILAINISNILR